MFGIHMHEYINVNTNVYAGVRVRGHVMTGPGDSPAEVVKLASGERVAWLSFLPGRLPGTASDGLCRGLPAAGGAARA